MYKRRKDFPFWRERLYIWYNDSVTQSIALYIHVPFCRRKCNYCSFVSHERRDGDIPAYIAALRAELAQRARGEQVRSIYFGGGTPSLLYVSQLEDVLAAINSLFAVDKAAEITIEANPGTVSVEYLTAIRRLGVNRLSLGIQSFNDAELALLGRIHNSAEAVEAVTMARESGFGNINLDLIYGLPGQGVPDWRRTLGRAIATEPEHLSLYALTLEETAPLWHAIQEGSLPATDPDLAAELYEQAEEVLSAHGYIHYEISNWAKKGCECRHNMVYWQNGPYLGAGVAAHSSLNGHRFANTSSLDRYLADFSHKLPPVPEMDEAISPDLQLSETVILGLRLCEGIDPDDIGERFGIDMGLHYRPQIEELTGWGLLEYDNRNIKLTRRGRLLGNEVFWRFLPQ